MIKKTELAALVVLTIIILAFALNWAVKTVVHIKKNVIVPDLTGQPLHEALDVLYKLNLGLKKEGSENNSEVPAGTIVRQQPQPGMSVREGKIIRITLSQGGESIFVPELEGKTLRSAEIDLRVNNLSLGEVRSRSSLKHDKDTVLSQKPAPKTIVKKQTLVHVVVSDGPPKKGIILMPDFVGKNLEDAILWAEEVNVDVETITEKSLSEDGTILSQSVKPDDVVLLGSSLKLIISEQIKGTSSDAAAHFVFQIPQGDSGKKYKIILTEGSKEKLLYQNAPEPGTKLKIPLPQRISPSAKIRIYVNGIQTEEHPAIK